MHKINVKALSVNRAWQGKRFKTAEYKNYEQLCLLSLPKIKIPDGNLQLILIFGVSNMRMDFDNGIKPFVDILQKKYGFNDSRIVHAVITKYKVAKGCDYIEFSIRRSDLCDS